MRAVLRKLHTEEGMSLGEALATVLIMSFVTLGIATGVTAGVRVYHEITTRAEEQTLLATNVAALSEYLEKGHEITTDGTSISIGYSEVSKTRMKIENHDQDGIYIRYIDKDGENLLLDPQPLISLKTNTSKLFAKISNISVQRVQPRESKETEKGLEGNNPDEEEQTSNDQVVTTFSIIICDKNGNDTNEKQENIKVRNTIQYPSAPESIGQQTN